jgi:phosphoribosyl 1,2-cyclic phosphodiesterase
MEVTILASGSKGNCAYIRGDSGALLVDAGLSARETMRRLRLAGGDETLIEAILVTHEHADHVSGVNVLARRLGVPVYATEGTLAGFNMRKSSNGITTETCTCGWRFPVGDFTIEPFAASHDALEPCGYCIEEGGIRIGCCTDTGTITSGMMDVLRSCDAVLLESNHCPDMLKSGPYPEFLKRRIRSKSGHLSNEDAARCLQALGGSIHIAVLAHMSEVNNTQNRVLASARSGLGLYSDSVETVVAPQVPDESRPFTYHIRI